MLSHCVQIVALISEFSQEIFVLKCGLFSNSNLCPMFNIINYIARSSKVLEDDFKIVEY